MKTSVALVIAGVALGLFGPSCGSSDPKKNPNGPDYQAGGEGGSAQGGGSDAAGGAAGETATQGGGGSSAGEAPTGGSALGGAAAAGPSGDAGAGGTELGGAAGAGGAGDGCPSGFAECDGDLSEMCEQDVSLVTSCGDCLTTCNDANGSVICEDGQCTLTSCEPDYGDCNASADDGCETLVADNDEHCGRCDLDCAAEGATCSIDRCSDVTIKSTNLIGAGGPFNANAWAFTSQEIVHMTRTNSVVQRFPLDGSDAQTIWSSVTGQSGNETLVIDGTDVLWAQFGTPSAVLKKSMTAAASTLPTDVFFPEYSPTYLRIRGNAFYWITGDYGQPAYVYTRSRSAASNVAGTRIVDVAQGNASTLSGFAVTTDAIYWVTSDDGNPATIDNGIRTTPLSGGAPSSVPAVAGAPDVTIKDFGSYTVSPSLTAVGDTLYFARTIGASSINGIYSFRQGDAAPTKLVQAEDVGGFTVDDTSIYYFLLNQSGIWRAPLAGGQGVMISTGYASAMLGTDAQFVYVAFVNAPTTLYKIFK